jgi:hypothetical protein
MKNMKFYVKNLLTGWFSIKTAIPEHLTELLLYKTDGTHTGCSTNVSTEMKNLPSEGKKSKVAALCTTFAEYKIFKQFYYEQTYNYRSWVKPGENANPVSCPKVYCDNQIMWSNFLTN